MITATNYKQIIVNLAKILDTYSGVDPQRILNRTGIRGADLAEMITSTKSFSPTASQAFILFELLENQEDDYITPGEKDNEMEVIQTYNFNINIYGNPAPDKAQKISALFKQENIVLTLREQGIYIKGVSPIEGINEFINDSLIVRRDLSIIIQIRHQFEDIGISVEHFDKNQKIDILVKKI